MKNILIIGHSSGIGQALSEHLAPTHRVFGTYAKNAVQPNHPHVSSHQLDVLDENPDFSFLPETLDGVVYCPGAINLKPFHRFKEADFIADYQLQVVGAVKVLQACLPALRKGTQPSVVLFSTVAVRVGFPFHSLVSSSKGALEGLTKALSAEWAPTIRVNAIAPSITDTPLAQNLLSTPEKIEANAQRHPLKQIGAPSDAAHLAAFLLGEQSRWMTGQILSLDGGMSAIRS